MSDNSFRWCRDMDCPMKGRCGRFVQEVKVGMVFVLHGRWSPVQNGCDEYIPKTQ